MKKQPITPRMLKQTEQIYEYICEYYLEHGYAPTYRQLAKAFRYTTGGIQDHMLKMFEWGWLQNRGYGRGCPRTYVPGVIVIKK